MNILIAAAFALSTTQIATVMEECHMAGLTYNNISNVTYSNTKLSSVDLRNSIPYENWANIEIDDYQTNRVVRDRGIRIYEQWCDSNTYKGPYTYFKKPLGHDALMSQLASCREAKGIKVYRPNVLIYALKLNYIPAETYATVSTSVWSLQPTEITCN